MELSASAIKEELALREGAIHPTHGSQEGARDEVRADMVLLAKAEAETLKRT
jgi:hypothetical protein